MRLYKEYGSVKCYIEDNVIYAGRKAVSSIIILKGEKVVYKNSGSKWITFLESSDIYFSLEQCIDDIMFFVEYTDMNIYGNSDLIDSYINNKMSGMLAIKRLNKEIKEQQKMDEIYRKQNEEKEAGKKIFEDIITEIYEIASRKNIRIAPPSKYNNYHYLFMTEDYMEEISKPIWYNNDEIDKFKKILNKIK